MRRYCIQSWYTSAASKKAVACAFAVTGNGRWRQKLDSLLSGPRLAPAENVHGMANLMAKALVIRHAQFLLAQFPRNKLMWPRRSPSAGQRQRPLRNRRVRLFRHDHRSPAYRAPGTSPQSMRQSSGGAKPSCVDDGRPSQHSSFSRVTNITGTSWGSYDNNSLVTRTGCQSRYHAQAEGPIAPIG